MSFSCTIKSGRKDWTTGDKPKIHYQLLNLGANSLDATDSPYRVSDFRDVVSQCVYGDRLKEAARDCFIELQRMAKENLESLSPHHCDTCHCPPITPKGWSVDAIIDLLSINPDNITKINGGY